MAQGDIKSVVRTERLRTLRNWSLAIGVVASAVALVSPLGQAIINNPMAWAPTGGPKFSFVAVLTGTGWRLLAWPMLICGAGMIVLSLLLTLVIRGRT